MTITHLKIYEANETIRLFRIFNEKYRHLFPKSWTIRLYAKDFRRAEVIPDTGEPLYLLGLGHDEDFYIAASKCFLKNLKTER